MQARSAQRKLLEMAAERESAQRSFTHMLPSMKGFCREVFLVHRICKLQGRQEWEAGHHYEREAGG